jgi:hypothetical protein
MEWVTGSIPVALTIHFNDLATGNPPLRRAVRGIARLRGRTMRKIGRFLSNIVNLYWNGTPSSLFCIQEQVAEAFR